MISTSPIGQARNNVHCSLQLECGTRRNCSRRRSCRRRPSNRSVRYLCLFAVINTHRMRVSPQRLATRESLQQTVDLTVDKEEAEDDIADTPPTTVKTTNRALAVRAMKPADATSRRVVQEYDFLVRTHRRGLCRKSMCAARTCSVTVTCLRKAPQMSDPAKNRMYMPADVAEVGFGHLVTAWWGALAATRSPAKVLIRCNQLVFAARKSYRLSALF
jgi:hypothetical protein